jgi:6-phosphofructo-2-kinase/fructose-2,6-biphosphatase
MTNARKIWLTRHGESEYNQQALIGGDSPLSPNGQAYAELLPDVILSRLPKVCKGLLCRRAVRVVGHSVLA